MKIKNLKSWSSEKLSQRLLYILTGVAAWVFAMFFLVGYDMPYIENPDFNAPLFTDALIVLMVVVMLLALAMAGFSAWHSHRMGSRQDAVVNGVPARKIARITWLSTGGLLLLGFAVGSSAPMWVNGSEFDCWFWLKLSDMFVVVSLVLLLAAIGVVLFGVTRYVRKERKS